MKARLIVSCIVAILALARGSATAQPADAADGVINVPPPGAAANDTASGDAPACPLAKDSQEFKDMEAALTTARTDVEALLKNACDPATVKAICVRYPNAKGCKKPTAPVRTTTTRRRPPKTPKPPVKGEKGDKGDAGEQGPQGEAGKNGANAYVLVGRVETHSDCPNGGVLFTPWTDFDADREIDEGEFTGEAHCAADGEDASAPKAHDGRDGRPGHDGTTVSLGLIFTGDVFRAPNMPEVRSSAFGVALNVQHNWAEGTLGALWSPGRDHGAVLTADFAAYPFWDRLGVRLGTQLVYAKINDRNEAKYQVIDLTPGLAARVLDGRNWKIRAEVHLGFGLAGTYGGFDWSKSVGGSSYFLYGF